MRLCRRCSWCSSSSSRRGNCAVVCGDAGEFCQDTAPFFCFAFSAALAQFTVCVSTHVNRIHSCSNGSKRRRSFARKVLHHSNEQLICRGGSRFRGNRKKFPQHKSLIIADHAIHLKALIESLVSTRIHGQIFRDEELQCLVQ